MVASLKRVLQIGQVMQPAILFLFIFNTCTPAVISNSLNYGTHDITQLNYSLNLMWSLSMLKWGSKRCGRYEGVLRTRDYAMRGWTARKRMGSGAACIGPQIYVPSKFTQGDRERETEREKALRL